MKLVTGKSRAAIRNVDTIVDSHPIPPGSLLARFFFVCFFWSALLTMLVI